jgi:EAL domain-containing protein (putative c-di-GMP-specific phosphodiesterase class I)/CBS domain-containing protein
MLQNLFHSKRLLTPRNKPVKEPQRQEMRHPMFQGLRGCSKSSNLVLFAIQDHYLYRELFGEDMVRHIEDQLKDSLISCGADLTSQDDVHCLTSESGEYLLLWPTRDRENLADLAYAIKIKAQDELKRTMLKWTGREVELGIGFARFGADGGGDWEKRFLQAVTEARRSARSHLDISGLEIAARFNELLLNKSVHAFYQPILDFSTGSIMGWEALARGPAGTSFQSPIMLFELAEQLERLFALEELCREKAITNLGEIAPDQRLFLNIHPRTMVDPEFTPGKTLSLLERAGMKPANIVFEITERHSLQDFGLFYRTLEHYRSQGFQVAVDDVGAGYSGLSSIAEIQPDFIKIDMSLVANVDRDPVKRALLETITTFAEKIGSKIIAEGIETRAQAICLLDIGVHYGQGYFLARPAFPRPGLAVDADELRLVGDLSQKSLTCSMPVGNLAEAPHAVSAEFLVSDAQHFFEKNRTFSSLVVTEDDKPKGLIMEYHLNRQLSSQYGVALFYKRPVSSIMDENPLSVDETTPVEQVAKQAMQREHLKAYDDIIVTKRGKLFGVVTVQKIMNTLAHVQVEMAKGTNPLTGLPTRLSFRFAGYYDELARLKNEASRPVDIFCIEEEPRDERFIGGLVHESLRLARRMARADTMVYLPKLKCHCVSNVTAAVKLNVGICSEDERAIRHDFLLNDKIVDLLAVGYPDFTAVDAIEVGVGNEGFPLYRKLGLILMGMNPLAVDLVGARLLGFGLDDVPYLKRAVERGYSPGRIEDVVIAGDLRTLEDVDAAAARLKPYDDDFYQWMDINKELKRLNSPMRFFHGPYRAGSDEKCLTGCVMGLKMFLAAFEKYAGPAAFAQAKPCVFVIGRVPEEIDVKGSDAFLFGACAQANLKNARKVIRIDKCFTTVTDMMMKCGTMLRMPSPIRDREYLLPIIQALLRASLNKTLSGRYAQDIGYFTAKRLLRRI